LERVLVVDDEADALEVLAWMLQDFGCDVRTATRVEEALALGRAFQPTLLITDYLLCDASTGIDVIRQLRECDPNLRAILVTGLHGDQIRELLGELANVSVLTKPFAWTDLRGQLAI
jgi:DNA-binding response OmpR family regulator